jgi:large subunit ribosomal protein L23
MALDFLKKLRRGLPKHATDSEKVDAEKEAPKIKEEKKSLATSESSSASKGKNVFAARTLKAPHISEKSSMMQADGVHVFKVVRDANKVTLKKAIEERYGVVVEKVRIVSVPGKIRRRGAITGKKQGFKKALVKLKEGSVIEEY